MDFEKAFSTVYNICSNTAIFSYFVFLAIIVMFFSLDYLNFALPDEENLLQYTGLFGNFALLFITARYAYDNNRMVKQNNLAQKTNLTKERLEKLYLPLKLNLNTYSKVGHVLDKDYYTYIQNPNYEKYLLEFQRSILEISPYSYLASDNLKPLLKQLFLCLNKNYYLVRKARDQDFETASVREKFNGIIEGINETKNLEGDIYNILVNEKENFNSIYEQILKELDSDIEKFENYLFNV